MGHYLRIFTPREERPSPTEIAAAALGAGAAGVRIGTQGGSGATWSDLLVELDGEPVATLDTTARGEELFDEEIEEFIGEAAASTPASNGGYVARTLAGAQRIYAFRLLTTATPEQDAAQQAVFAQLHRLVGGLIHAEGEGFSEEGGTQITWEREAEAPSVPWEFALIRPDGTFDRFRLDLSDAAQITAFRRGERHERALPLG